MSHGAADCDASPRRWWKPCRPCNRGRDRRAFPPVVLEACRRSSRIACGHRRRQLQVHAHEEWMEKGYLALGVMEKHLERHDFFAANRYTIADIALYAYTHVANESEFDLTGFPAIRRW